MNGQFIKFSRFFLFLLFSSAISLAFLLMLPIYQYYTQRSDLGHVDKKKEEIRAVQINLSKKPEKPKKLKVKISKPQVARDLARADKFELDLTATSGTGVALGSGDTADIVYDQNQVDSLPVRLRGRAPRAPKSFLATGERGVVELDIVISTDGAVIKASLVKENPKGYGLAAAAIASVKTWKFRPALLNGIPVKLRVIQPFSF